jgi:hypothetical protein
VVFVLLYIYYYYTYTIILYIIYYYTILFSSQSFPIFSSHSPHPNIHSILVGTYIYLFIFYQDIPLPLPHLSSLLFYLIFSSSYPLPNLLFHSLILFLLSSNPSSFPSLFLPIFILYLSVLGYTYLYSSVSPIPPPIILGILVGTYIRLFISHPNIPFQISDPARSIGVDVSSGGW